MARDEWGRAADEYENMVGEGSLTWVPLSKEKLPETTRAYFEMFIEKANLPVMVAKERLYGTVLMKLGDPVVAYFHHDPIGAGHQFANEGFHDAIDNNAALVRLGVLGGSIEKHEVGWVKQLFDEVDTWEDDSGPENN